MGYDTMLMSMACGPKGTVVAFEPDHQNLQLLLRNLAELPHMNVAVHSAGLGDVPALSRISESALSEA